MSGGHLVAAYETTLWDALLALDIPDPGILHEDARDDATVMCWYEDVTNPTDSPLAVALYVNGQLFGASPHDGRPMRP